VIAALVVLQTSAMLAVKGASPHKARTDRQIEQIESAGERGTISVIVRSDGTTSWESLLKTLRRDGVRVGRQARGSNAISLKIPSTMLTA
jgi:translation initiation factor IF-2